MKLSNLLLALSGEVDLFVKGRTDLSVGGIQYDSRRVVSGDLFICIEGFVHDGHRFIEEAVRRGAVACVVQKPVPVPENLTVVQVGDTRRAMARLANCFYGDPSRSLKLVGVTGTNGKTTTSMLCRSVLQERGSVGLIGTVENIVGERQYPVERTTPESVDLQRMLRQMVDYGSSYAVMEVSSHSLVLNRVDTCRFTTAVFTNVTRDHLDFHGDFEHYLHAKARLFREHLAPDPGDPGRAAIINWDDPHGVDMARNCPAPVWRYGIESRDVHVRAEDIEIRGGGAIFTVCGEFGRVPLHLPLTGRFNIYNALAAFTVGLAEGIPPERIASRLESAGPVKGRFQLIPHQEDFAVIVDYAHTPDGLENILRTAREITRNRVLVVFGCGGDRDRGKRPIMGQLAGQWADYAIITSDNPRTEQPLAIMADIEQGIKMTAAPYEMIEDRAQAIHRAIAIAQQGDVVLIAGKGHETYQILGSRTIHFDDSEVAAEALQLRQMN